MEATACFKNLILKAIHDAVSYAGDTNHPWSTVGGDKHRGTSQEVAPTVLCMWTTAVASFPALLPQPPGVPDLAVSMAHSNPSETSQSMSFF